MYKSECELNTLKFLHKLIIEYYLVLPLYVIFREFGSQLQPQLSNLRFLALTPNLYGVYQNYIKKHNLSSVNPWLIAADIGKNESKAESLSVKHVFKYEQYQQFS